MRNLAGGIFGYLVGCLIDLIGGEISYQTIYKPKLLERFSPTLYLLSPKYGGVSHAEETLQPASGEPPAGVQSIILFYFVYSKVQIFLNLSKS